MGDLLGKGVVGATKRRREVILGLLMILSTQLPIPFRSTALEGQVLLCTGRARLTTLLLLCTCNAADDHTDMKSLQRLI
jgi:hypothetical protein